MHKGHATKDCPEEEKAPLQSGQHTFEGHGFPAAQFPPPFARMPPPPFGMFPPPSGFMPPPRMQQFGTGYCLYTFASLFLRTFPLHFPGNMPLPPPSAFRGPQYIPYMSRQEFLQEQARQRDIKAGRKPRNGCERTDLIDDTAPHHSPHHATDLDNYFTICRGRDQSEFENRWNSGGGFRGSDRNRYGNIHNANIEGDNKQDLYSHGNDRSISSSATRESTQVPRKRSFQDESSDNHQKRSRMSKPTIDDTIL